MRISRRVFFSMPSLFKKKVKFKKQKRSRRTRKAKTQKEKNAYSLFVMKNNKIILMFNWQHEEKRKPLLFENYHDSIVKMAKKLAQRLSFDWQDLAYIEGYEIFEKLKNKWNPDICGFDAWFCSKLEYRMLDRLQKKDIRQAGVRRGNGKYHEADFSIGAGSEMEKALDCHYPDRSMSADFEDEILERFDRQNAQQIPI